MLRQHLHPPHPARPQTLRGRAERVPPLTGDDADSLEDGFPAVAAEDGRVVDPLQAGFELGVEGVEGDGVDAAGVGAGHAVVGAGRGGLALWVVGVGGGGVALDAGRGGGEARGGGGVGVGGGGDGGEAAFAEALEDGAGFPEEVVGSVVLAAGDEGEGAGEHVGGEELHAALDDARVRGDRGRGGAVGLVLRLGAGGEHGDGEEGGARGVGEGAVAEDVAVREVGLDQGHLLDRERALLVRVEGSTEGLEARDDGLPGVLRELFLGCVVRRDDQLDEDIWWQQGQHSVQPPNGQSMPQALRSHEHIERTTTRTGKATHLACLQTADRQAQLQRPCQWRA